MSFCSVLLTHSVKALDFEKLGGPSVNLSRIYSFREKKKKNKHINVCEVILCLFLLLELLRTMSLSFLEVLLFHSEDTHLPFL